MGQQKVLAYENNDRHGDSGDRCNVICQKDNEYWERQVNTLELYDIEANS